MGAAVLVTDAATARELGPRRPTRWPTSAGWADAHDVWYLSERPVLQRAPGSGRVRRRRPGRRPGLTMDDVDAFDLYACFPSSVEVARDSFGIAADDPRPLTLTGGLPYHGGPGSNYVTHSMANTLRLAAGRTRRARPRPRQRLLPDQALGRRLHPAAPDRRRPRRPTELQERVDAPGHGRCRSRPSVTGARRRSWPTPSPSTATAQPAGGGSASSTWVAGRTVARARRRPATDAATRRASVVPTRRRRATARHPRRPPDAGQRGPAGLTSGPSTARAQSSRARACSGQFSTPVRASSSRPAGTSSTSSTQWPSRRRRTGRAPACSNGRGPGSARRRAGCALRPVRRPAGTASGRWCSERSPACTRARCRARARYSGMRRWNSRMATRSSTRARCDPRQRCTPPPKARWGLGLRRRSTVSTPGWAVVVGVGRRR